MIGRKSLRLAECWAYSLIFMRLPSAPEPVVANQRFVLTALVSRAHCSGWRRSFFRSQLIFLWNFMCWNNCCFKQTLTMSTGLAKRLELEMRGRPAEQVKCMVNLLTSILLSHDIRQAMPAFNMMRAEVRPRSWNDRDPPVATSLNVSSLESTFVWPSTELF